MKRSDGRALDEMRNVSFQPDIAPHANGSVLVAFGDTRVICSAMIENKVPRWMQYQNVAGGWLTAEYNMLPYSTLDRKQRDISRGKLDGRSSEIQRLIGRSLRAVVDLKALGSRTLWVDCDVLQADGGTRTASITGACVASSIAFNRLVADGTLRKSPMKQLVSAVSAGVYEDTSLLDLCYVEDRDASVDCNVVMTENLELVEIQGSGEEATFSRAQMNEMLDLSEKGIQELTTLQKNAIASAEKPPEPDELLDLTKHFSK